MNATILIFAMRHALPRTTSAPSIVVREIKRQWISLSFSDRELIESEIKNSKLKNIGDVAIWTGLLNWIKSTGSQIV